MKSKDIALIAVVVFISGLASFFVSRTVFISSKNRQQKVESVESISTSFTLPPSKYFNNQSVDPTQSIQIGNNNNPDPFGH